MNTLLELFTRLLELLLLFELLALLLFELLLDAEPEDEPVEDLEWPELMLPALFLGLTVALGAGSLFDAGGL